MADQQNLVTRIFGGKPGPVLLRLVVASVIVGAVLSVTQIDPTMLWRDFFGAIGAAWDRFWEQGWAIVMWIVKYLALGAVIVIPVWVVLRLLRGVVPGTKKDADVD